MYYSYKKTMMLSFMIKSISVLVQNTPPASDELVSVHHWAHPHPHLLCRPTLQDHHHLLPEISFSSTKLSVSTSEARSRLLSTLKGIKCPISSPTSVPQSIPQTTDESVMSPWLKVDGSVPSASPLQLASCAFLPTATNAHSFPRNSTFCVVMEHT